MNTNKKLLCIALFVSVLWTTCLYSTESEVVSIRAFIRDNLGKITEVKNFKKNKHLKVDDFKQQLSHFSIELNEFTGSSEEHVSIKIYDNDTIYFENDVLLSVGNKQDIRPTLNPYLIKNKQLKLKVSGYEEFEGDIIFNSQNPSEIKIGTQIWTTKNLDVSTYRNGEVIFQAKTQKEWQVAADSMKSAWCYYEFDEKNAKTYGKLYNWYAVNDRRGLAPKGYHIPSVADWNILITFLGNEAGKKLKSKNGWNNYSKSGNGNNSSGFNAIPGGYCLSYGGFMYLKEQGSWWSSSTDKYGTDFPPYYFLGYTSLQLENSNYDMGYGLSVRCIKD